jgi:hypothetical protein
LSGANNGGLPCELAEIVSCSLPSESPIQVVPDSALDVNSSAIPVPGDATSTAVSGIAPVVAGNVPAGNPTSEPRITSSAFPSKGYYFGYILLVLIIV